jgi:hypothetical protein
VGGLTVVIAFLAGVAMGAARMEGRVALRASRRVVGFISFCFLVLVFWFFGFVFLVFGFWFLGWVVVVCWWIVQWLGRLLVDGWMDCMF